MVCVFRNICFPVYIKRLSIKGDSQTASKTNSKRTNVIYIWKGMIFAQRHAYCVAWSIIREIFQYWTINHSGRAKNTNPSVPSNPLETGVLLNTHYRCFMSTSDALAQYETRFSVNPSGNCLVAQRGPACYTTYYTILIIPSSPVYSNLRPDHYI